MRRLVNLTIALLFLNTILDAGPIRAQFAELARQVPSSANALALINVEKLMDSPIAKREGWAAKRERAFSSGVTFLPPDGKFAILANQLDLSIWVPIWEAAILAVDHEIPLARIAAATGGHLDNVAGHDAVALPADAYVVKTGDRTAAFMAPANRQSVARWMREADARQAHQLSPYLAEAFRFANDLGTPVILALDLEDALPANDLQALLDQPTAKEFLAENKLDPQAVLSMLIGLRGITLGVTFSEKPFGKVKVDFRTKIPLSAELARAALLQALAQRGAMIDEFSGWKPAVNDKQVTLEGYLTESGLRRLSSLFDRPPALKVPETATVQQPSNTPEQYAAQASQQYFHQVQDLLDDLSKERKNNRNYNMAQIGVWMDKYAKKVDQLPVLNVDPELIQYGAFVADALRAGYTAIRTSSARSRVRQLNTDVPTHSYGYQGVYGYTYRTGYSTIADHREYWQDRTRVRSEERVISAQSARDIMAQVDDATAEIRRKMTQKYQINF